MSDSTPYPDVRCIRRSGKVRVDDFALVQVSLEKLFLYELSSCLNISVRTYRHTISFRA